MENNENKSFNDHQPELLDSNDSAEPSADSPKIIQPTDVEATPAPAPITKIHKKFSLRDKLVSFSRLYLLLFGLLVIATAIMGFVIFKWTNESPAKKTGSQSLTSKQLAQLKENTTIVGDPKQTLDIQSDTLFQGQVLARKDLEVAGALKVGGKVSFPSVEVSDVANFGQLQINGSLTVSGNSTFAGQLSAQKNLTVSGSGSFGGSLSAASLTVTSLQLSGNLTINRHIVVNGAVPAKTNGSAVGGGGTASVSGTDTAGTITVNTGSSPPAGVLITITFTASFGKTPKVIVTPVGSAAASLGHYVTRSTTSFSLATVNAPPASSTFSFDYFVVD